MNRFPTEWVKESDVFTVEVAANSVVLCVKAGKETEFDAFTRAVINSVGDYVAFPRQDFAGRYDSVELLSTTPQREPLRTAG